MGCGTILQLVAYGAQDIYLTGNPQISFFKTVFKRHTNFTIESIKQTFTNIVKFPNASPKNIKPPSCVYSCIIERKGDLIKDMHLEVDIIEPTIIDETTGNIIPAPMVKRPGHSFIEWIEIQVGGVTIDRQPGEWMDIWNQLSLSKIKYKKLENMINGNIKAVATNDSCRVMKLYIPLNFWFCKNPGTALPLLALNYHEIKFNIKIKSDATILSTSTEINTMPVISSFNLYCDCIFLDSDEKKKFTSIQHEYLVEQVQCQEEHIYGSKTPNTNIKLNFNHPCKELIWICQDSENYHPFCFNKFGDGSDLIKDVNILFNNNKRFETRDANYFKYVQPYFHHSCNNTFSDSNSEEKGFIHVYSFALNPETYTPSGSCNFSRIDIPQIIFELNESSGKNKHIRIYARNYNVFRVKDGVGSLMYSN